MSSIFSRLSIFTTHENVPSDFRRHGKSALVHFIQQAREIRFSTFYTAGTGNQNEAAESLPGVIGSL
jgi:hypothetical protein